MACAQVRDKMDTAKRDTVDRVDKYTKKYKPTADKYNKLCVLTLVPTKLRTSLRYPLAIAGRSNRGLPCSRPSQQHSVLSTCIQLPSNDYTDVLPVRQ